jgi:hypothetical protein
LTINPNTSKETDKLASEKRRKNSVIMEMRKSWVFVNLINRENNNKTKKAAIVSKKNPGIEGAASLSRMFLSCSFGNNASISASAVTRNPIKVEDMLTMVPELEFNESEINSTCIYLRCTRITIISSVTKETSITE